MGRAPRSNPRAERVKSADRTVDLLELLAARPDGATFAEITGTLALPKSSVHALLHTLVARGYAELSGTDRRFRLGLQAAELGAMARQAHGLLERARPALSELAVRTGETTHLAVLDGVEIVYRLTDESDHTMRLVSPLGQHFPAHATAAGKVLLAGLSDEEVVRRYRDAGHDRDQLPGLTGRTVKRLPDLLRELDEVRRLGHAHDVEGFARGVHCVAAPVTNAAGHAEGAISISIPTARLDRAKLRQVVDQLDAVARRTSQQPRPEPATPAWQPGRVRIAWVMRQTHLPLFQELHRVVAATAESHGADVLWVDSALDMGKQECDVHAVLALRPDVLVLHPAHSTDVDALYRAAATAGIPSICFRRPARSDAYNLYVGSDTFHEGVLQMDYVARRLDGRGTVAMIEGDPYNDEARNIAEGNRHVLAQHPDLKLVGDESMPGWSAPLARAFTARLLDQHGRVDAIVCGSDTLAGGTAEALADHGLTGDVILVGGDGDQTALQRLHNGTQDATIFENPSALAQTTLQASVRLARSELDVGQLTRRSLAVNPPSRPMPALDIPRQLVTRDDVHILDDYWNTSASP